MAPSCDDDDAASRDDDDAASRDTVGQAARVGGAVLAGGRSRRMGRDKAGIEVAGATLLERTRAAVAAALGPPAPVVAVGTPGGPHPGAWIPDRRPEAGPLAGLEAALGWAQTQGLDGVLLVGVDHPWLEPQVLRLLADGLQSARPPGDPGASGPRSPSQRTAGSQASGSPASVPAHSLGGAPGGPHGVVLGTTDGPLLLLGAYRTDALPVVTRLLDDGERRLQSLRLHLDLEVVPPAAWRHLDPDGATARDVDDPSQLEAARRHLTGHDAHDPAGDAG